MKHLLTPFYTLLLFLTTLFSGSCLSSDGSLSYDRTARAVFASAGAMRELALDPSFDPEFQAQLLETATVLNGVGHAILAAAVIGADDTLLVEQISVGLAVIQQTLNGLDPDKYQEYRPYFITAQVLLSVMQTYAEPLPEVGTEPKVVERPRRVKFFRD